ncbi:MAG: hypothetical protein BWZ02_03380 [Lentisphaerae bacterium ADurb.BinA184]|nr:MAG: hypothetical protein BWZ02_03380 [Lentisphaerae bacterium ADurb.BinA184]
MPLEWLLYCTWLGSRSVILIPVAVLGPLLVATRMYSMICAENGWLVVTSFWTPTSADTTQLVTLALMAGWVELYTLARLVSAPAGGGVLTTAWNVMVSDAPGARV